MAQGELWRGKSRIVTCKPDDRLERRSQLQPNQANSTSSNLTTVTYHEKKKLSVGQNSEGKSLR